VIDLVDASSVRASFSYAALACVGPTITFSSTMAPEATTGTDGRLFSPHDDSRYAAINLTMLTILPMAVKAFTELGIPDILAKGKGPMTAEEIVAELPTKSQTGSAQNVKRLLRPLVREDILSESLTEEKNSVYGLTEISKWFTSDIEGSVLPYARNDSVPFQYRDSPVNVFLELC
jgi:hypothetical protein